jgi:hypothetical protein
MPWDRTSVLILMELLDAATLFALFRSTVVPIVHARFVDGSIPTSCALVSGVGSGLASSSQFCVGQAVRMA